MHALFRLGDALPVAPGESPFHMRGLYFDRLIARARKDPGGLPRLLGEIEDPRVRAFAQQKFNWSGWYDIFPIMPIYSAIARIRGQEFETAVREGTRLGAVEVIPSLFRLGLRVTSPAALAGRAASVVLHTSDFTSLSIQSFTETRVLARGSGIPLFAGPHIVNLVLGFFQAVLEMRGGTGVQGRYGDVRIDGAKGGFETVTVPYEFNWAPNR